MAFSILVVDDNADILANVSELSDDARAGAWKAAPTFS